jgi:hypothetical protein
MNKEGNESMRFGRYIVGLPSLDNDTLLVPETRELVKPLEDESDDNGAETKATDAIV